jgi:hypothetical protein
MMAQQDNQPMNTNRLTVRIALLSTSVLILWFKPPKPLYLYHIKNITYIPDRYISESQTQKHPANPNQNNTSLI